MRDESKLAKQIEFLENISNVRFGLVCTYASSFSNDQSDSQPMEHIIYNSLNLNESLLVYNFIPASSVMLRTELINSVGFFDKSPFCTEDWDLWIRISKISKNNGI